ncbi:hypothetical protein O9929_11675 [Vibrio lentus]|nr:hypothetical protein [Vibrio lentus]
MHGGLYSNIGYKFEIAEFDIIPKVGINYLNADVNDNSSFNDINIDNAHGSIGTTNWRMIGLTVDDKKINDSAMVPDGSGGTTPFEEDVVRVTAPNF